VGGGDGGILRRVRAAQEVAPERAKVSLVCQLEYGKHWRQRLSVTIIRASDGGGGGSSAGEVSKWQWRDPQGDLPTLPRLNGL
jgi:hypothetical protein